MITTLFLIVSVLTTIPVWIVVLRSHQHHQMHWFAVAVEWLFAGAGAFLTLFLLVNGIHAVLA